MEDMFLWLPFSLFQSIHIYAAADWNIRYLQGQIGNPDGQDKPNKKFYDPRVWLRKAEDSMVARVIKACNDLDNSGTLSLSIWIV